MRLNLLFLLYVDNLNITVKLNILPKAVATVIFIVWLLYLSGNWFFNNQNLANIDVPICNLYWYLNILHTWLDN